MRSTRSMRAALQPARAFQRSFLPASTTKRSLRTRGRTRRQWEEETGVAQRDMQLALRRINELMRASSTVEEKELLRSACPALGPFLERTAKSCRIRPSTMIHGRGLFATRDIRTGEVVSLFPAQKLGLEVDQKDAIQVFSSEQDRDYFEQRTESNNSWSLEYTRPGTILSGTRFSTAILHLDVNPHQPVLPAWQGHFVNDGAKPISIAEKNILEYYRETNRHRNCFHVPFGPAPLMATVATRDIANEQELLSSYDLLYWVVDIHQQSYTAGSSSMMITEAMGQQADRLDEALWESTQGLDERYKEVMDDMDLLFQQMELLDY